MAPGRPNGRRCRRPFTACRRYASCWQPPTAATWSSSPPSRIPARDKLDKLSQTITQAGRSYSGFNLFDADDEALFQSIIRGEFNISGLQNKSLRRFLPDKSSGQISRLLKRLRVHGLIKKVGHTYKYYVTSFGKDVIATGLKLRELVIIPQLAYSRVA